MKDIFSTAQGYVVAPLQLDWADFYGFVTGMVLAALFFHYFNRRYE